MHAAIHKREHVQIIHRRRSPNLSAYEGGLTSHSSKRQVNLAAPVFDDSSTRVLPMHHGVARVESKTRRTLSA